MIDPHTTPMLVQAITLARRPIPMARGLANRIEWDNTLPSPLVVALWINQTTNIIHQYQDLLTHLVELQVQVLDNDNQRNQQPTED